MEWKRIVTILRIANWFLFLIIVPVIVFLFSDKAFVSILSDWILLIPLGIGIIGYVFFQDRILQIMSKAKDNAPKIELFMSMGDRSKHPFAQKNPFFWFKVFNLVGINSAIRQNPNKYFEPKDFDELKRWKKRFQIFNIIFVVLLILYGIKVIF